MRRVRSQDRLQGFDPEPERTFHKRLREAMDTNNIHALVQFPVNMAEEHMVVQEVAMPSIANVTSSIVKPRITGHFELKQSMIQLLHANGQFMDYVRLTLFPFSLLGEAKRWLKAEPANSITSWNDLSRKFLARFFPSGKTAKIRSEIVAFRQKAGESLYSPWERFKGLLRDCPHHNQTNEVLAHTFIEGLHSETKIVVDVAVGGQVLEKRFDEIYISTLTNKVTQMTLVINKQQAEPVQQVQIFCEVCGEGHMSNLCPANPEFVYFMGNANRGQINQYGDTYNPNWRNHPNFSWGGNQGPSSSDVKFRATNGAQLASAQNNRPVGALPSDTEPNPKAQVPKPVEENEKENKGSEPVIVTRPPPPFPQRLQKQKEDAKYKKFLDILIQVRVNLPLVKILQEVPKYASAKVQSKLPPKLKDPGSFTIPLSLEKQEVGRALCDLGTSINLMPSFLFKQLGLEVLRPTTITLQLADRSLVRQEGIIEDVLVRVGKFILPADFIVLDYEADEEVSIILGRPFLAIGGVIIDVREEKLKMRVDNEEITFNVYKPLKLLKHYEDLCMITVVELKGIEQSPYMNCSDPDGTTELEEVVLQAECVNVIEKRARDERRDLPRACKKARFHGRKKKRKRPA
nr:uncharacterized protein LOC104115401 [Nicotiana tomentosiformis]